MSVHHSGPPIPAEFLLEASAKDQRVEKEVLTCSDITTVSALTGGFLSYSSEMAPALVIPPSPPHQAQAVTASSYCQSLGASLFLLVPLTLLPVCKENLH